MKIDGKVDFAENCINYLILSRYFKKKLTFFKFKDFEKFIQLKLMEMLILLKIQYIYKY